MRKSRVVLGGVLCGLLAGCATDYSKIVKYEPYRQLDVEELSVAQFAEYPLYLATLERYADYKRRLEQMGKDLWRKNTGGSRFLDSDVLVDAYFNESLARSEEIPFSERLNHVRRLHLNGDFERLSAIANDVKDERVRREAGKCLNEYMVKKQMALKYTYRGELINRGFYRLPAISRSCDIPYLMEEAMGEADSYGTYRGAIKRLDELGVFGGSDSIARRNLLHNMTEAWNDKGRCPNDAYKQSPEFKSLFCAAVRDPKVLGEAIARIKITRQKWNWIGALPEHDKALAVLFLIEKHTDTQKMILEKLSSSQAVILMSHVKSPEERIKLLKLVEDQDALMQMAEKERDENVRWQAKKMMTSETRAEFEKRRFKEKAEQGDSESMYDYAVVLYKEGRDEEGNRWMDKAVNANCLNAILYKVQKYEGAANTNRWCEMLEKAASLDHAQSYYDLGRIYMTKDEKRAKGYLCKAYKMGVTDSGLLLLTILAHESNKPTKEQAYILTMGLEGDNKSSLQNLFLRYSGKKPESGNGYYSDETTRWILEVKQVVLSENGVMVGANMLMSGEGWSSDWIFVKTLRDYDVGDKFTEDVVYVGKTSYHTILGAEKQVRIFESVGYRKAQVLSLIGE